MDDATRLTGEGQAADHETKVGDTAGSPTWPIPDLASQSTPPPVGLNWGVVAQTLEVDLRILEHEGLIVLAGQYFPEAGFFIDPDTFHAQRVDVGDCALRHGYFIGNLTAREFAERLTVVPAGPIEGLPVVRREQGPIIGLFPSEIQARRTRTAILQGAIASGLGTETGPLGVELRVTQPIDPGAVASLIAGHGGAVISIAGRPVAGTPRTGRISTSPGSIADQGDAFRPGTGVVSDSTGDLP